MKVLMSDSYQFINQPDGNKCFSHGSGFDSQVRSEVFSEKVLK